MNFIHRLQFLNVHYINYYLCIYCVLEKLNNFKLFCCCKLHFLPLLGYDAYDFFSAGKSRKNDDKVYNCLYCSYSTKDASNCRRHMLKHSGKKYECVICNKKYVRKDYLRIHLRTHGIQIKKYSRDNLE